MSNLDDKALVMVFRKETVYAHTAAADVLRLADHAIACGRAFEAWLAEATAAHAIDAPSRRLLEELHDFGPRPVPKLARGLRVSRQAVQPLVDAMIAAGRVERLPNPANRRSLVVQLTAAGFALVTALRAAEAAAAEKVAERFLADHVMVARRTLANLLFATTGARAWQFPRLRPSYAALYGPKAIDDTALLRHPLGRAGRHLR